MIEIKHPGIENTKQSSIAYERIYRERGISHLDSFYLMLIEFLNPEPGKLLSDISCGEGRLVCLATRWNVKSVGIDFVLYPLITLKRQNNEISLVNADAEKLPIRSNSVDYVFNIGSIEHYLNPESGIREIARILKPGGKACILLPNLFGLFGNVKYVAQYGEVFDDGQPIQRYATLNTWKSLLNKNNLLITKVIGYNEVQFPRTFQDLKYYLVRPQKFVRLLISQLIPLNLSNHFIFLCELKS